MNLVGYVRVSTEEQAEHGHSIQQQLDALTRWATEHGHQLHEFCIDRGVSAAVPMIQRPAGKQLRIWLKDSAVDGVVVTRLDRLFRDALDGLFYIRTTSGDSKQLLSIGDQIDTSTAVGRAARHAIARARSARASRS